MFVCVACTTFYIEPAHMTIILAVEHTLMSQDRLCFLAEGRSRQNVYFCDERRMDVEKKNVACKAFVRATLNKAK